MGPRLPKGPKNPKFPGKPLGFGNLMGLETIFLERSYKEKVINHPIKLAKTC
jgi:hypothetical protein